ncbi:MAG TPA: glycosyltransferase [Ignavibacteriaceae bacterium]|nr:glycosyltransferase [Ignavibacteriaceae bacterium]
MLEPTLLILFTLISVYYLNFILRIYRGLGNLTHSTVKKKLSEEFISIIIPFRNEEDDILKNLASLEKQNYPINKFEIIYVNDSSDDSSVDLLLRNKTKDNIRIITVPDKYISTAHKKRAVKFGIENAKGEIIVSTDADCTYDPEWLQSLVNCIDKDTGFVSGPVEFEDSEKLFSKLQKLEFAGLVITGAGLIGINEPIICNAANIAYRKKVFNEVKGFSGQMNLSSGDDEILMQKISKETKYKIKFCLNRKSIVKTRANNSVNQFYQQRKRWASKGLFYPDKKLITKLILIFSFYFSLPILIIIGFLISNKFLLILLLSLIFKIITEFLVLKKGTDLLFNSQILKPFLLAELLHIPYILFAGISGVFGNFTWKERRVKR